MVGFLMIGLILTVIAAIVFIYGLYEHVFIFGPFIALLVGINFVVMGFIRWKQEKRRTGDNTR